MCNRRCTPALFVQDTDQIDDGVFSLELLAQEFGVVHVAFRQPHRGQHQEVAVPHRVTRENNDVMPGSGQARGEALADETGAAEKADLVQRHRVILRCLRDQYQRAAFVREE
jgi:hypothetical protein